MDAVVRPFLASLSLFALNPKPLPPITENPLRIFQGRLANGVRLSPSNKRLISAQVKQVYGIDLQRIFEERFTHPIACAAAIERLSDDIRTLSKSQVVASYNDFKYSTSAALSGP